MTGIKRGFNIGMFLYLCLAGTADYLFRPESRSKVPWEALWAWSPFLGMVAAIFVLAALVFFGALLFKTFWNGFVSDVFKLRNISYSEALAVILILATFSL